MSKLLLSAHTRPVYHTSLIALSGLVFDEELIRTGNYIDKEEMETLKVINEGKAIRWISSINYDLNSEEYSKIFSPAMKPAK